ncbi:hypothetical protein ACJJTC_018390 [Scirpophaga incertulas]
MTVCCEFCFLGFLGLKYVYAFVGAYGYSTVACSEIRVEDLLVSIEVWLTTGRRHSEILAEQKLSEGQLRRPGAVLFLWLKCEQSPQTLAHDMCKSIAGDEDSTNVYIHGHVKLLYTNVCVEQLYMVMDGKEHSGCPMHSRLLLRG